MSREVDVLDCPAVLHPIVDYLEELTEPASLARLEELLKDADVSREELEPLCAFSDRRYRRNLVARSEWYDLLVLCWRAGQRSPIHDHRGSACAFRVVEGTGIETRFERTGEGREVREVECVEMPKDFICAAFDDDIHDVANGGDGDLITLHVYSPRLKMNAYPRPKATR